MTSEVPYAELGVLGDYLADCRSQLSASTVASKWRSLSVIERQLGTGVEAVSEVRVRSWWRSTVDRYAPATRAAYLSHLRGYVRWLMVEGLRIDDPVRRIRPPRLARRLPRDLDSGVVVAALVRMPARDALAVEIELRLGLRRAEAAQILPSHDLVMGPDRVFRLRVHGKGGRERSLPVPRDLALRLLRWSPRGYLFPSAESRSGHLSPDQLGKSVARALRAQGIAATGHQLRHTAGTAFQAATGDVLKTAAFLGHATVATAQVYAQAGAITGELVDSMYPDGGFA